MDKEFQTSFVPKKSLVEKETTRARGSIGGLFNIIALVLFIASILAAGAAYFYRSSIEDKIAEYKVSLDRARNAFEPTLITKLQELDKRMMAATEILNNHVAVSPIFELLEDMTLPTVRYSDFSYEFNRENKNLVDVKMSGEAKGYNYIALQADLFGDNKFIKNPIFSDFTLDQLGNVDFALTFTVDKSLVIYESFLERAESLRQAEESVIENNVDMEQVPTENLPVQENDIGNQNGSTTNPFIQNNNLGS
ncbi:MAG: hypothetical protein IT284_02570 [Bacteroidetes bacterium]|nr:hypothetical protein [Bacteroidota bacterium]